MTEDGEQLGVITLSAALIKAQELEVDLIEIAPEAKPPVAKLIDFKKFKYLEDKKEKEARKKTKNTELKEVRFSPFIGEHDLQTNLRKVKEFLGLGDTVKISIVFKGRQMTHQEFGPKLLTKIMTELGPGASQDRPARMEGRRYVTVIRGSKGAFKPEPAKPVVPNEPGGGEKPLKSTVIPAGAKGLEHRRAGIQNTEEKIPDQVGNDQNNEQTKNEKRRQ